MQAKQLAVILALGALSFGAMADKHTGGEVLKSKGCMNCHDAEKKKMGPPFKEIAAKKAGKADELAAKVSGAKGHPKVKASEAEVKAAVQAILATK